MNVFAAADVAAPRRRPSRSNSLSSTSTVTVKRTASFKDPVVDPPQPHRSSTPPGARRRSSAAAGAGDALGVFRDDIANLNLWDKPAASLHPLPQPSFSRHLQSQSLSLPLVNGAAAHPHAHRRPDPSPTRTRTPTAAHHHQRSPASSPRRSQRPRSPIHNPPPPPARPPQIPVLPALLPATVYDPNSPHTGSSSDLPSTAGLLTPTTYSQAPTDYFAAKPRPPPAQRPPSRTKADRILGRSPLGSPPVGVLESEARYRASPGASRPLAAGRPSTGTAREAPPKPAQSAAHERSFSKEQDYRDRSGSNASSRLDDGVQGTPPRTRERREKDKKTMLSRALQKANTAVLLDNAQNFEGAMEAYGDACKLLQQVMIRSSGEEDKRKLDAIRVTYTNRIEELRRLDPGYHSSTGKSLPARPMSNESLEAGRSMLFGDDDEEPVIETAKISRIVDDRPVDDDDVHVRSDSRSRNPQHLPLRSVQPGGQRESVISTAIRDVQTGMASPPQFHLQPPPGRLAGNSAGLEAPGLESPMDRSYMPPPLSPRRPISPLPSSKPDADPSSRDRLEEPTRAGHQRVNSTESISWLDTIDESGGSSCSSSVHSLSPRGLRRKHIRNGSGATEAEFDAALDAAVEAAYDEGYEPYEDGMPDSAELRANRLRNVELAKERVREAEREEAIAAAKYRYKETQLRNEPLPHVRESAELNFHDEAEEEERLLDEITREYMLDGFDFDLQTKSSLPRQSDSSGFSGSTYNSSVSSHRTTGGTSLSTVAEVLQPTKPKAPISSPPPVSASSGTLASVSESRTSDGNDASETTPKAQIVTKDAASVRSRRLSGQNLKSLKIETSLPPVPPAPHTDKASHVEREARPEVPPLPKSAAAATFSSAQPLVDATFKIPTIPQSHPQTGLNAPSPQTLGPSSADTAFAVSPATLALNNAMSNDSLPAPASPKAGKGSSIGIRKNKSSLSLKQRNLSVSSPDGSDGSVATPMSATFNFSGRKASIAPIPTPTPSVPTFNVDGLPSGGMHLFESDIHSPYSPGSPSGAVANAPIPLEPCPESYLLRPFWLMRCFYQTIVHPRGGYLSTKLFIPRDVWRVKGVKLKNVDDKIANCDLLTAALQRLSTVDTLDADAVLEEMQAFEVVLDQVQTQLAKKLGNEVGMQGVSVLFKDAYTVGVGSAADGNSEKGSHGSQDHAPKSGMSQSKSYLTSWRKLRSKNSAVGLSNMAGAKSAAPEVSKDSLTMATLPMTNLPNIRFAKRDVSNVAFEGPNGGYMSSLAKLFDSVQILDQIARQVEDPGLKHSSPTHVGLELCARHAAEFFGFYICRFVLADMTLMLDKFIKRGSEWVLV
ncbi:uncharacterized protein CC84DRAFT_7207 [Paraphaeosphaeria sporulosa]|uniref:MIT domain-containing protein n=1 Tax=Paraphaeosphaeria sporulosa TaxID=1460663 RepID=A0A177CWK0_9PLEO|nr:uncharacterized protein CC84DRAFT_7207 [Paraphaeosphaeria sporulosa]OAG11272.1 hypothetical protein CC84DRAFT_7207 [Paraphaeosphaeria sporulosa]